LWEQHSERWLQAKSHVPTAPNEQRPMKRWG
jgi:hypothetical protein